METDDILNHLNEIENVYKKFELKIDQIYTQSLNEGQS